MPSGNGKLKIGFTGAGGTGKTTLAKLIAEKTGLPFMESPSRACFEKRGIRTEDDQNNMSAEGRLLLQIDIFEAITKQSRDNSYGVFDRTNLDNLFYALFRCHDTLLTSEIEQMIHITVTQLKTFDILIFVPIYPWAREIKGDGMRTQTFAPRLLMSGYIQSFLQLHNIPYRSASNHSAETRAALLMDVVVGVLEEANAYEVAFKNAW